MLLRIKEYIPMCLDLCFESRAWGWLDYLIRSVSVSFWTALTLFPKEGDRQGEWKQHLFCCQSPWVGILACQPLSIFLNVSVFCYQRRKRVTDLAVTVFPITMLWMLIEYLLYARYSVMLPLWLSGKEPICQCRRCGFDPWVGKIPWRRKWPPLQYFCLESAMDWGVRLATAHGVAKESDRI